MQKKKYIPLEVEVIRFSSEDVITKSGGTLTPEYPIG